MTQAQIADLFMVDARSLRTWTARYLAEGLKGLRARGGQGRKPAVSDEDVAGQSRRPRSRAESKDPRGNGRRVQGVQGRHQAREAREAGEKRPRRRAPVPAKCRCGGSGGRVKPSKCRCAPGRACKCKCCRNLKLPPRGPRHAPGCPRARIRPKSAITAAILCATIFGMFGKMYSAGHMYAVMSKHNLASKKLLAVHINHASYAAVKAWQWRLKGRLKKLRDAGYAICSFDECFMVRDKSTGRMWIERGKRLAQLYTGSRDRIVLFGYFENCTHRFQEYAFADSCALIDSLRRIGAEYGKVAIVMDRMSAHQSEVVKKFLREYRLANPGRDIQLIFLPRGSPYLNVVEECWNLLKKAVAQHHYCPARRLPLGRHGSPQDRPVRDEDGRLPVPESPAAPGRGVGPRGGPEKGPRQGPRMPPALFRTERIRQCRNRAHGPCGPHEAAHLAVHCGQVLPRALRVHLPSGKALELRRGRAGQEGIPLRNPTFSSHAGLSRTALISARVNIIAIPRNNCRFALAGTAR